MSRGWPVALTVAGSDSSGGAGIQADLKTFAALEVYGASAITAVTVQNTRGVTGVHLVPAATVAEQIDAVFADLRVRAVKTGMLGSAPAVSAVATTLRRQVQTALVVDPVMLAAGGEPLLETGGEDVLAAELLPLATLITPNLPEARRLAGIDAEPAELARRIQARGAAVAVLVTGGHAHGSEVVDHLRFVDGSVREFRRPRLSTSCTHGTGCTLSAAVTAFLARGLPLEEAVARGGDYLHRALAAAWPLGSGRGPVHHMHPFWEER